jgi:hypothetical protein
MGAPAGAVDVAINQLLAWWRLDDKRETFAEHLRRIVTRDLEAEGRVYLYIDYDPNAPLLEALGAAGVEPQRCMYSADPPFSCHKSGVWILCRGAINGVRVKHGYGDDWSLVWGVWPVEP